MGWGIGHNPVPRRVALCCAILCLAYASAAPAAEPNRLAHEGDLPGDQGYMLGECLGWVQARSFSLTHHYISQEDRSIQATLRAIGKRGRRIEQQFNASARRINKLDIDAYATFLEGYTRGLHAARRDSLVIQIEHGEAGVLNVYDQVIIQCP